MDSYQGKIASKTTAVGVVWADVSSHPQSWLDFLSKFGWFGDDMTILKIIESDRLVILRKQKFQMWLKYVNLWIC